MLALACLIGPAALAAGISGESRPDPLLDGTVDGPCAALTDGPDYVSGTNAQGDVVVPPDVGAPPVPIPDSIMVPLHAGAGHSGDGRGQRRYGGANPGTGAPGDRPYVAIDGRRMGPLINPPACGRPPAR